MKTEMETKNQKQVKMMTFLMVLSISIQDSSPSVISVNIGHELFSSLWEENIVLIPLVDLLAAYLL